MLLCTIAASTSLAHPVQGLAFHQCCSTCAQIESDSVNHALVDNAMSCGLYPTAFMPAAAVHSRTALAQTARTSATARHAISMGEKAYTLVLVRHGESTWNDENRCIRVTTFYNQYTYG
jgi:hypothetical protein